MEFRPMIIACIIYVVLGGLPYCGCYETRSVETRQVFGWTIYHVFPYRIDTSVRYKMDCIVSCVTDPNCTAVEIDQDACSYFDESLFTVTIAPSPEHSMVLVREIYGLNAALYMMEIESYTYSEAEQACSSLGGRLAYESELQIIYDNGVELLMCGWMSGGERRFIIQTMYNEYGNRVGLVDCNHFDLAAAWCSLA